MLAAIANQTILAGRTLRVTNSASDPDVPPQVLTYSLLTAPSGAAMNTNSGVFAWRPAIAQSPSTQSVAVVVSDSGVPVMSATQAFTVSVNQPIRPTLTAASMTNGQFSLMISGDTGPDYIIQTSTNLASWSAISTSTPSAMPYLYPDTNTAPFPYLSSTAHCSGLMTRHPDCPCPDLADCFGWRMRHGFNPRKFVVLLFLGAIHV